jgi:hypothetical protein
MRLTDILATLREVGTERWQHDALCVEHHPEVSWFPERGEPTDAAKAICARCLVREECLEYALREDIREGIWGGLALGQRRALRREAAPAREPTFKHGYSAYVNRGCRCSICTEACRLYRREQRARAGGRSEVTRTRRRRKVTPVVQDHRQRAKPSFSEVEPWQGYDFGKF